ncbi:AsmA family protein [Novimethylophilus kurashikiensis]|uniref:AsmA family protein n=1 Tax=Novimethylophilus kurashikiensis TaxID=1825523 RepID=A0A2R5FA15_9PROT|nr:AsmA family protein [Novimethylophilus kurashikiensis]GBG15037.1 AsmA family protein [Novimethylophilus kurashikiensis]
MALSRPIKWIAGGLLALILIVALMVVFFDWNWLRGPIARTVTESTGRQLVINGNLDVHLGWPLFRVHTSNVTFANPEWAKQRQMVTLDEVDFSLDIPALLRRKIHVPDVRLNKPAVDLEISGQGQKNWLLDKQQSDESTSIPIDRISVQQGRITFDDDREATSIRADFSTQNANGKAGSEGIAFNVAGQYKRLPLAVDGTGGPVLALQDDAKPYPLKINAKIGKSGLIADGRITNLRQFSAIDMNIALSGESMALLYPIIGIALPETGPYRTQGRLVHQGKMWRYESFTGNIGHSDVAGTLQVDAGSKRPFMHGEMRFDVLDLADLGPVIGTSSTQDITVDETPPTQDETDTAKTEEKADKPAKRVKTSGHVLPSVPFKTQRWNSVDADVKLHAKRIERPKQLPIENLDTRLQMRDAKLTLEPLDFGIAGGHLAGNVMLDGHEDPIQAHIKMNVSRFRLNRMFPTLKLEDTNVGEINGAFDLKGHGNAVANMLGSSNGKMSLIIAGGEISRLMMEAVSLHLLEILQLKITGDKPIRINCGVADFNVRNGTMNTNLLLLDTSITSIFGDGDINLSNERMNMVINQETKKTSPIALTSPIYIQGTFGDPDVHLDKKRIATKGLGALALGAITPLLALIPLVDPDKGFENECTQILKRQRAKTEEVRRR